MFFLITDKFSMGDLVIQHKGTGEMWADVNTKPTQGKRLRVMRGHVMGISEDYDDDVISRRTHPLLLPKIESEQFSVMDGEVLEKAAVLFPAKAAHKERQEENKHFVSTPRYAGRKTKECVRRGQILTRCWVRLESRECPLFGLLQGPRERSG